MTTTMASFTGSGCSSSLFPAVQPKRYPTTAVTPATVHNAERDVGHRRAVQLGPRFLGHQPVGGAHEAGEHPDNQQVRVNRLRDVEGQQVDQRIGAEVLRGRQQPEHHLKAVEQQRHDEIRISDGLSAIAHLGAPLI